MGLEDLGYVLGAFLIFMYFAFDVIFSNWRREPGSNVGDPHYDLPPRTEVTVTMDKSVTPLESSFRRRPESSFGGHKEAGSRPTPG
jgi:hypothetical protein